MRLALVQLYACIIKQKTVWGRGGGGLCWGVVSLHMFGTHEAVCLLV